MLSSPLFNHRSLTSPDRGQGLNHCIVDATNIVKALVSTQAPENPTSLASAITAYDEELVKRGADEVETSRKNALLVHDFNKFMDSPVMKVGYAKAKAVQIEETKKEETAENDANVTHAVQNGVVPNGAAAQGSS
jgi:2-polyprenyl-6-methoxyphenol hydroxylase-like FAD-dependent oxidoreductase